MDCSWTLYAFVLCLPQLLSDRGRIHERTSLSLRLVAAAGARRASWEFRRTPTLFLCSRSLLLTVSVARGERAPVVLDKYVYLSKNRWAQLVLPECILGTPLILNDWRTNWLEEGLDEISNCLCFPLEHGDGVCVYIWWKWRKHICLRTWHSMFLFTVEMEKLI